MHMDFGDDRFREQRPIQVHALDCNSDIQFTFIKIRARLFASHY